MAADPAETYLVVIVELATAHIVGHRLLDFTALYYGLDQPES